MLSPPSQSPASMADLYCFRYSSTWTDHGFDLSTSTAARHLASPATLEARQLAHIALIKHQDAIRVHHRVQSMRYCQHCTLLEARSDGLLHQLIVLHVHRRSGSSSNTTLASVSMARARHTSCRCPAERFPPASVSSLSRPLPVSVK